MTFEPKLVKQFVAIFEESKNKIRNFEGCLHLELWNDQQNKNIYFTYSHWQTEEHLHSYRHSPLFIAVWKKTKALFAARPEAWSVTKIV